MSVGERWNAIKTAEAFYSDTSPCYKRLNRFQNCLLYFMVGFILNLLIY